MINRDVVKRKASSLPEFQAGTALSEKGAAVITGVESFWKGEQEIRAKVQEDGKSYRTVLLFKQDKLYEYSCSCKKDQRGLCRHCAAAALEAIRLKEEASVRRISTSLSSDMMLAEYESERKSDLLTSHMEDKVELFPVLSFREGNASVSFRIGARKKYVLKDLTEFAAYMKEGAFVSYGRSLEFFHRPEAFSEDALPILRFLLERVGEYQETARQLTAYGKMRAMRELPLSGAGLDRFFFLFAGKELLLEDGMGIEKWVPVKENNPELTVTVSGEAGRGYCFQLPKQLLFFQGMDHLYVWDTKAIWICSREYEKELLPFFRAARRVGVSGEKGRVEIGEEELPLFCSRVLPGLTAWTKLKGSVPDASRYPLLPLENRFYFDREEGNILLRIEQAYGEERFSPLSGKPVQYRFRDEAMEELVSRLVIRYFRYRSEERDCFVLREEEDTLFSLWKEGLPRFRELGEVYLSESFRQIRVRSLGRPRTGILAGEGWLRLTVDLEGMTGEELSRMLSAYRRKKHWFRMEDGSLMEFSEKNARFLERLERGLGLTEQELTGEIRLDGGYAWYLDWLLEETPEATVSGREELKAFLSRLSEQTKLPLPEKLRGELREYQKEGYRWLYGLSRYGFGGLLADEMGLGKTVQLIALLCRKKEEGKLSGPCLVVCPASLIYNWEQELWRFAPELSVLPVVGNQEERRALLKTVPGYDVVVTSYELLKRDVDRYKGIPFEIQVIDEAQYIKNAATQNARAVKRIRAKCRFALTGTPMENRLSELWSIFDYLMPGYLKSYGSFRERFESPIVKEGDPEADLRLRRLIAPFFLRRLKKDVLKDLPPRLETVVYSGLSGEQKKLYTAHAAALQRELEEGGFEKETVKLLAGLTRLRQLCCDPRLYYENYEGESAKLDTCMELVKSGISGGHRILLFSQFASMLALIGERLKEEGISWFVLTGETPGKERMELVNRFQNREAEVFLISLKAGGTGLNLTAADTVILYDPWWNVAAQNQAADRAHRMGQENPVSVFKLIMRHTIEENMVKLQEAKAGLSDRIIGKGQWSVGELSREELLRLIDGVNET